MKSLLVLVSLTALGGCAVPGPAYYTRTTAPVDPYQWHVVSSSPVQPGQRSVPAGTVEYSAAPVYQTQQTYVSQPAYVSQPVYLSQPVYVPQPVYYQQPSYWYPPVTIGLDFMFWGGGSRHGGWGGRGRGRR